MRKASYYTILSACLLAGTGVILLPGLKTGLFVPEEEDHILISVPCQSADVIMVEKEVTAVIEGTVSLVEGITDVESVTREGMVHLRAELEGSMDPFKVRFMVSHSLFNLLKDLPGYVQRPQIDLASSGSVERCILVYYISGECDIVTEAEKIRLFLKSQLGEQARIEISEPAAERIMIYPALTGEGVKRDMAGETLMGQYSVSLLYSGHGTGGRIKLSALKPSFPGAISIGRFVKRPEFFGSLHDRCWKKVVMIPRMRVNGKEALKMSVFVASGENVIATGRQVKKILREAGKGWKDKIEITEMADLIGAYENELINTARSLFFVAALFLIFLPFGIRVFIFAVLTYIITIASTISVVIVTGYVLTPVSVNSIITGLAILPFNNILIVKGRIKEREMDALKAVVFSTVIVIITGALIVLLFENVNRTIYYGLVISMSVSTVMSVLLFPSFPGDCRNYSRDAAGPISKVPKSWGFQGRYSVLKQLAIFGVGIVLMTGLSMGSTNQSSKRQNGVKVFLERGSIAAFADDLDRHEEGVIDGNILQLHLQFPPGICMESANMVIREFERLIAASDRLVTFITTIPNQGMASIEIRPGCKEASLNIQDILKERLILTGLSIGGMKWHITGRGGSYHSPGITDDEGDLMLRISGYDLGRLLTERSSLIAQLGKNPRFRFNGNMKTTRDQVFSRDIVEHYSISGTDSCGIGNYLLSDRGFFYERSGTDELSVSTGKRRIAKWDIVGSGKALLRLNRPQHGMITEIRRKGQEYYLTIPLIYRGIREYGKSSLKEFIARHEPVLPAGFHLTLVEDIQNEDSHYLNFPDIIWISLVVVFSLLVVFLESIVKPLVIITRMMLVFSFFAFISQSLTVIGGERTLLLLIIVMTATLCVQLYRRPKKSNAKRQPDVHA